VLFSTLQKPRTQDPSELAREAKHSGSGLGQACARHGPDPSRGTSGTSRDPSRGKNQFAAGRMYGAKFRAATRRRRTGGLPETFR
jgi:hypothetical protein